MQKPLRVLTISNSENDTLLILHEIECGGFVVKSKRINNTHDLKESLANDSWDIIVSDSDVPQCKVLDALKIIRRFNIDTPFIFITETEDEKLAIAAMRAGANDYLIKDNLSRLVPVIERELQEVNIRYDYIKALKKLIESEKKYRELYDFAPAGYFSVDKSGNIIKANQTLAIMLGYTTKELIGRSISSLCPDVLYSQEMSQTVVNNILSRESPIQQMEMVCKNGIHIIVSVSISPEKDSEGCITGARGIIVNLTQQKMAERALSESREYASSLLNSSPHPIIVINPDTSLVYVNPAFEKLTGYTIQEIKGIKPPYPYWPKDTQDMNLKAIRQSLQEDTPDNERTFRKKNGDLFHVVHSINRVLNDNGTLRYYIVNWVDITERKTIEASLRESEENFRSLANNAASGIMLVTYDGRHTYVNEQMSRMTGYSVTDLMKMKPHDLLAPKVLQKSVTILQDKLDGKESPSQYESAYIRKDGTTIPVEIVGAVTSWKGQPVSLLIINDITERKRMEAQLMLTDRLASIGELASGIAHEINNPLTSVIGFSELLMERELPEDIKEDLKLVNQEAQRAAGVVKNLLTFARKHPDKRELTNINDVISHVLELRSREQKINNIQALTKLAPDLPPLMINAFQMQQVFLNLVINAEYFMTQSHKKGNLIVTSKLTSNIVTITFTDDGPGISPENMCSLFNPFFTTKEVGKGTGLGLSICHGIITSHQGRIYAESTPGKGSSFIVELPATTVLLKERY